MADVLHGPDTTLACLTAIRDRRVATTGELMEATGLSRPTVVSVLTQLRSEGLVGVQADQAPAGRQGGRPARRHAFDPTGGLVLGIDVSTDQARVLVADLGGTVVAESEPGWASPSHERPGLESVVELIGRTLASVGRTTGDVRAAGLGVAGLVDDGKLLGSPTARSWTGTALGDELAELAGFPVVLENDLVLAAAAEASIGAMAGAHAGIYVLTWHHVSSRITIDGVVLRGRRQQAGEVGLLNSFRDVEVPAGDMVAQMRVVGSELARLRTVPDDVAASAVLERLVQSMTPAVAALVLTVDPDIVVLGGSLGEYADLIASPLADAVAGFATGFVLDAVVTGSRLGTRGVALGALESAFDTYSAAVYGIPGMSAPILRNPDPGARP